MKKPVQARGLNIRLYGMRKEVSGFGVGVGGISVGKQDRIHTDSAKIYDFVQKIDTEKEYFGEQDYSFKIKIPSDLLTKSTPDGMLGNMIKMGQIMSGRSSSINWFVSAYLDIASGFDVSNKAQIVID